MKSRLGYLLAIAVWTLAIGCVVEPTNRSNHNKSVFASPSATISPSPSPTIERVANAEPLTLPVLDAFFADEGFSGLLKTRLQLTDEQIARLKELAHEETGKLSDAMAGKSAGEGATARAEAEDKISALIGQEKATQLASLVRERWSGGAENTSEKPAVASTNPNTPEEFAANAPNAVPTDSRIVVNAPAYRMDVFDAGRLIKSYKVGIGYPQFPLPTGLRKARTIIFNPTWTPPDEPWVAKMKNVNVGEQVEAGSKFNPLGPIKIPIGGPSLIHGGKSPAKLGTFASHGCVGLTTPQVQDFTKLLARLGGAHLTDSDLARYVRDKTETKQQKLAKPIPVELRYETIVVEDGELHIYRDVYDQDTNTEENLRAVLEANGVRSDDLSDGERTRVLDALAQMSGKSNVNARSLKTTPRGSPSPPSSSNNLNSSAQTKKTPRVARNQKEIVIQIAALRGKGYPAPVDLDSGSGRTKVARMAPRR